jgi:hypothetical protein
MRDGAGLTRVALPWTFEPDKIPPQRSVELWLGWSDDKELELSDGPVFY